MGVKASAVIRVLVVIAILLLLASTAGQISVYVFGHGQLKGLVPLFYLGDENNIPTYFSVCLMLIASFLLALIAMAHRSQGESFVFHWATLSCLFLLMGYDEAFEVHERLIVPMRALLGDFNYDFLFFAWVVPGIVFVTLLGVFFSRFLMKLPPPTAFQFLIAAAVYLSGALGMEMAGGKYIVLYGHQNLVFSLIVTLEEGLEIAGLILFIRALLKYCAQNSVEMRFSD